MKCRIYNSDMVVKGTICINENASGLSIQFGAQSILTKKFIKLTNDFLKRNNLKIIKNKGFRKNHKRNNVSKLKPKGFDMYVKHKVHNLITVRKI